MTIKFTTTELESQNNKLQLLFEFLDSEIGQEFDLDYMFALGKAKYVGGLQSAQIQGAYLDPLVLRGTFYGTVVDRDGVRYSAKERSDQIERLVLRPVKFFFDNFKQIVIIESYKRKVRGLERIDYEITMFPHDIQNPIKPSQSIKSQELSQRLKEEEVDGNLVKVDNELVNKTNSAINKLNTTKESYSIEKAKNKVKKDINDKGLAVLEEQQAKYRSENYGFSNKHIDGLIEKHKKTIPIEEIDAVSQLRAKQIVKKRSEENKKYVNDLLKSKLYKEKGLFQSDIDELKRRGITYTTDKSGKIDYLRYETNADKLPFGGISG